MHRTDGSNNVANQFVDIVPGVTPGTLVEHAWLNAVQEELVNVILTKAGISLVKGTWTQLGTSLDFLYGLNAVPGGRLTLATGTPVTTGNISSATTVYYTPYKHDRICLYNGTTWKLYTFAELQQATTDATKSPAAMSVSHNYDCFVWDDAGTVRCTRGPEWTSDTARGTGAGTSELEFFGSRWVNKIAITNGPAARCGLYVGSLRSNAGSATDDRPDARSCWNTYNRVSRPMVVLENTTSWNYTTYSFRQANASVVNRLDYIVGLNEDSVSARVEAAVSSSAALSLIQVGIGVDSTVSAANDLPLNTVNNPVASCTMVVSSSWRGMPGIGRHVLNWLERASGGTVTWKSDSTSDTTSGIYGEIMG